MAKLNNGTWQANNATKKNFPLLFDGNFSTSNELGMLISDMEKRKRDEYFAEIYRKEREAEEAQARYITSNTEYFNKTSLIRMQIITSLKK